MPRTRGDPHAGERAGSLAVDSKDVRHSGSSGRMGFTTTPHPQQENPSDASSQREDEPYVRQLLVEQVSRLGWTMQDAAQAAGVSVRTGWRWIRRFRDQAKAGLLDRRSTPHRMPRLTAPRMGSRSSVSHLQPTHQGSRSLAALPQHRAPAQRTRRPAFHLPHHEVRVTNLPEFNT